jgi:hypothetical protein
LVVLVAYEPAVAASGFAVAATCAWKDRRIRCGGTPSGVIALKALIPFAFICASLRSSALQFSLLPWAALARVKASARDGAARKIQRK